MEDEFELERIAYKENKELKAKIKKGNEILAKYMGLQYCYKDLIWISNLNNVRSTSVFSGWISNTMSYVPGVPIIVVQDNKMVCDFVHKLVYNTDWNVLMEVVQKIKTDISFKSVDECTEDEWYVSTGVTILTITSSLNEVWYACVRYAEWHNKK